LRNVYARAYDPRMITTNVDDYDQSPEGQREAREAAWEAEQDADCAPRPCGCPAGDPHMADCPILTG